MAEAEAWSPERISSKQKEIVSMVNITCTKTRLSPRSPSLHTSAAAQLERVRDATSLRLGSDSGSRGVVIVL